MKLRSIIASALLLALAFSSALAINQVQYIRTPNPTGASVICYFNKAADGTTYTAANRAEYSNVKVTNGSTASSTVRIYHRAAPNFAGAFSEAYASDFQSFDIAAGASVELSGTRFYGFAILNVPSGNGVTVMAWR